jgi:hypothetical protein
MHEVIWRDTALDALADAYVAADRPTRDRIEAAVVRLNSRLAESPESEGESRPDERRITFAAPVAIIFRVDEAALRVRVIQFWTY